MAASIKRIGELKQQVYRDFACGFSLSEDLPDRDAPYWSMASSFSGDRPATAQAQAQALLQLLKDEKVEAWLYRFGLPDLFVHTGVIALSDKGPVLCDPFTGLMFAEPITAVLDQLDRGETPKAQPPGKDRKVCVLDAEVDPRDTVERLARRAERELVGGEGQRAFLLDWTADLYVECAPELRSALEALKGAGFAQLLLYPVEVSRGDEVHTDIGRMPVIGPWFAEGQPKGGAERSTRVAQGAEAARMASLSRLVGDLRRDLEAFRQPSAEPTRRALARPGARTGRMLSRDEHRMGELEAELWDHQSRAERAEAAVQRLEANHARMIEEATSEHRLTQEALRRASAELAEARGSLLMGLADTDRLKFEVERLTRDRDAARQALNEERARAEAEAADLARQIERLEQRLEQLRGSVEDATRETREARDVIVELETALAASMTERASDIRRFEEERKLLLVAQGRLEREVQAVRGELNGRTQESEALARTLQQLAYAPTQGRPVIAPDQAANAHAEVVSRIDQRIAELELAKAAAEAELHNHRTMLANSRYMRTRAALSRLLGRARR